MLIRTATAADISALIDLERLCASASHWSERQYEQICQPGEGRHGDRLAVVAEDDQALSLLGFLIAHHLHPEWELENLVVAPDFRRKGLATKLFAALLTRARETNSESIFLEVRESNRAARGLYVRLGFRQSGRRKLYYANPAEDAVLYRFALI